METVVVGEGMLELSGTGADLRLGHGGDTLNTALHMVRSGMPVSYATALGADPFSAELRQAWLTEGLDVSTVLTDPTRLPGLYAIRTDAAGERSFAYWRSDSAARHVFTLAGAAALLRRIAAADLVYFSLISLAVLDDSGRHALIDAARQAHAAGRIVAFDGNYRPALWGSADAAAQWRDAALAVTTIGLPTLEDEIAIGGEMTAAVVEAHWRHGGAREVVVKLGADGCLLTGGLVVPPAARLVPVDTSGAGDAFNAGYLVARTTGATPEQAAAAGHRLAGWVIGRRGAVPPRDAAAPYPAVA